MINRVRDIVVERDQDEEGDSQVRPELRLNFMSWNASSAALGEIIEYLEELVDLTKLLVGSSEFRSGMLFRPTYHAYIQDMELKAREALDGQQDEDEDGDAGRGIGNTKPPATHSEKHDKRDEGDATGKTHGSSSSSYSDTSMEEKDKMSKESKGDKAPLKRAQSAVNKARLPQFDGTNEQGLDKAAAIKAQGGNNAGGEEEVDDLPLPLQRITTRAKLARQLSRSSLQSHSGK